MLLRSLRDKQFPLVVVNFIILELVRKIIAILGLLGRFRTLLLGRLGLLLLHLFGLFLFYELVEGGEVSLDIGHERPETRLAGHWWWAAGEKLRLQKLVHF